MMKRIEVDSSTNNNDNNTDTAEVMSTPTFSDNSVDVCFVVKSNTPPMIPIRMELQSQGFETVRTRVGVCQRSTLLESIRNGRIGEGSVSGVQSPTNTNTTIKGKGGNQTNTNSQTAVSCDSYYHVQSGERACRKSNVEAILQRIRMERCNHNTLKNIPETQVLRTGSRLSYDYADDERDQDHDERQDIEYDDDDEHLSDSDFETYAYSGSDVENNEDDTVFTPRKFEPLNDETNSCLSRTPRYMPIGHRPTASGKQKREEKHSKVCSLARTILAEKKKIDSNQNEICQFELLQEDSASSIASPPRYTSVHEVNDALQSPERRQNKDDFDADRERILKVVEMVKNRSRKNNSNKEIGNSFRNVRHDRQYQIDQHVSLPASIESMSTDEVVEALQVQQLIDSIPAVDINDLRKEDSGDQLGFSYSGNNSTIKTEISLDELRQVIITFSSQSLEDSDDDASGYPSDSSSMFLGKFAGLSSDLSMEAEELEELCFVEKCKTEVDELSLISSINENDCVKKEKTESFLMMYQKDILSVSRYEVSEVNEDVKELEEIQQQEEKIEQHDSTDDKEGIDLGTKGEAEEFYEHESKSTFLRSSMMIGVDDLSWDDASVRHGSSCFSNLSDFVKRACCSGSDEDRFEIDEILINQEHMDQWIHSIQ